MTMKSLYYVIGQNYVIFHLAHPAYMTIFWRFYTKSESSNLNNHSKIGYYVILDNHVITKTLEYKTSTWQNILNRGQRFQKNNFWCANDVISLLRNININILNDIFSLKNNQSRRNLLTYQNECELNEDELGLVTSTNWNRSIDLTFDRTKPGLRFCQIGKSHRLEFKFKNSKRLFTIGSLSTLSSNQWNENHILYPSE